MFTSPGFNGANEVSAYKCHWVFWVFPGETDLVVGFSVSDLATCFDIFEVFCQIVNLLIKYTNNSF